MPLILAQYWKLSQLCEIACTLGSEGMWGFIYRPNRSKTQTEQPNREISSHSSNFWGLGGTHSLFPFRYTRFGVLPCHESFGIWEWFAWASKCGPIWGKNQNKHSGSWNMTKRVGILERWHGPGILMIPNMDMSGVHDLNTSGEKRSK